MGVDTYMNVYCKVKGSDESRCKERINYTCLERFFLVFCTAVEKCYPATEPTTPNPQTTPATKSNSHVVPIAVGCSLAALVIIIGVGYMIGRRRRMSKEGAGYRKL